MILHDRSEDQPHEYFGCNDFLGQGTCSTTLAKKKKKQPLGLCIKSDHSCHRVQHVKSLGIDHQGLLDAYVLV